MSNMTNEQRRLNVLKRYCILDTPPEETFDRIIRMAIAYFQVPIAVVSFIDETRQWFKAVHGLDVPQTGRDVAFCHYAIMQDDVTVVLDTYKDERFHDNPLVTDAPRIRAYAGAPLITCDGFRLGTVAIIDTKPWQQLKLGGREFLRDLARIVSNELDMRWATTNFRTEIEDRKRAEHQLRLTTARLEQALEAAERANRSRSQFFVSAGHDLRQPFQAMALFHEVLTGMIQDGPPKAALDGLGQAMAAGQGLVNGLLDVSTLDAGEVVPEVQRVDLDDVLSEVALEVEPQGEVKFVRVPCSARVMTDPMLLGRMLGYLLTNAVKFTAAGTILLGCRRLEHTVRIELWDTGLGIPADMLDKVFDDFVQLGNPERDRTKGVGLGLGIVKRMGLVLGHKVSVRSWPGRGSCFAIEVPRLPSNAMPVAIQEPRRASG